MPKLNAGALAATWDPLTRLLVEASQDKVNKGSLCDNLFLKNETVKRGTGNPLWVTVNISMDGQIERL